VPAGGGPPSAPELSRVLPVAAGLVDGAGTEPELAGLAPTDGELGGVLCPPGEEGVVDGVVVGDVADVVGVPVGDGLPGDVVGEPVGVPLGEAGFVVQDGVAEGPGLPLRPGCEDEPPAPLDDG
jgi:hypothetical protein